MPSTRNVEYRRKNGFVYQVSRLEYSIDTLVRCYGVTETRQGRLWRSSTLTDQMELLIIAATVSRAQQRPYKICDLYAVPSSWPPLLHIPHGTFPSFLVLSHYSIVN